MNIYGDESGSLTKTHSVNQPFFVIALAWVKDPKRIKRSFKRFISTHLETLRKLDGTEGKMFKGVKFREIKGNQLDRPMKKKFVDFFSSRNDIELFFIEIDNKNITDDFCKNTARAFNYVICLNFKTLFTNNIIPKEECYLQLDERNEKTETKYFLENYLNTELLLNGFTDKPFHVQYFDSKDNICIQIADVFANILYSHLRTAAYSEEIKKLASSGLLRYTFRFPLSPKK